jgi:hypothetical protein
VRILILIGFTRLVTSKTGAKTSVLAGGFNNIDSAFLCWALCHAFAFMLLYHQFAAAINQFGFLWDSLGGYFFLRFAIRDEEDICRTAKVFVSIAMIVAVCMVIEQRFMTNVFSFIGGHARPDMRAGKLRSQGPFAHAILAGVFGATIMPLFLWLGSTKKTRSVGVAGVIGATAIVITSASSTPLGAYVGGILGLCFWPLRRNMRLVRWSMVVAICLLALVMKAPVWFLLARVDLVGGSSGYHRAMLLDTCIRRFSDWWLLGADNNQNWGWDMWDIQNEFVAEALRGGMAACVFFIIIVSRSLGLIGRARKAVDSDRRHSWLIWLLGTLILTHVIAFFGSDYFDQTRFWWYASLAIIIAAATAPLVTGVPKQFEFEFATGFQHSAIQDDPRDVSSPVSWHPAAKP